MNLFNDHLNLSNNIYDNAKILKSVQINKQQESINRNPTAKYYQTIALNLHEQVQYLKRRLNEEKQLGVVHFGTVDNMSPEDLMAFGDPARYVNPKHSDYASENPLWNGVTGIIFKRIRDAIINYVKNNPREVLGDLIGLLGGPIGIALGVIANAPGIIKLIIGVYGMTEAAWAMLSDRLKNGTASPQEIQMWELMKYMLTSYYNGGYVPLPPSARNDNPTHHGPTTSTIPNWANQGGNH